MLSYKFLLRQVDMWGNKHDGFVMNESWSIDTLTVSSDSSLGPTKGDVYRALHESVLGNIMRSTDRWVRLQEDGDDFWLVTCDRKKVPLFLLEFQEVL